MYQEKACCDQGTVKEWISIEWANPFKNPIGQNSFRLRSLMLVQNILLILSFMIFEEHCSNLSFCKLSVIIKTVKLDIYGYEKL